MSNTLYLWNAILIVLTCFVLEGVEFQDCDVSTAHYKISTDSSDSALETIANIPGIIPIIVAHRETIRRLAGEHVLTPYCCIALYRFLSDKINSSVIVDGTATQLEQSLKISGSTTVVARSGNSMVKVVSTSQNGSERKSGKRGISVDYANFKDTSQFLLLQLHDRNGNVIETSTTR